MLITYWIYIDAQGNISTPGWNAVRWIGIILSVLGFIILIVAIINLKKPKSTVSIPPPSGTVSQVYETTSGIVTNPTIYYSY